MSIVMDASSLITIQIMYIEETRKHGSTVFRFIHSQDELDGWKEKGYLTQEEFDSTKMTKIDPGMPEAPVADPNKIISVLNTWWSRMSWKEENACYSQCMNNIVGTDGTPIMTVDAIKMRDMQLKTCLKKWSLTDNEGREVPISDLVIDNLVPEVANELLSAFEKVTEVSEEDLKN